MKLNKLQKIGVLLTGLLLVYTLTGFLIVSRVVQDQIIQTIQKQYGVTATVEKVSFNPLTFEAEVQNFRIPSDSKEQPDRLVLGRLNVNLQILPLLEKRIVFKSFYLGQTTLDLTVLKNGLTNWTPLQKNEASADSVSTDKPLKSWTLTLEQLQVEDTQLNFQDQTHREPLQLALGPIELTASNISTSLGSRMSLENLNIRFGTSGQLQVGGQMSLAPLIADIHFDVQRLPLQFMTSYLSDKTRLAVKSGELSITGRASYREGRAQLNADAQVNAFELVEKKTTKSAISWKSMQLNQINVHTAPVQVRVGEVILTGLYTSLALKKDGVLNYKDYLRDTKVAKSSLKSGDRATSPAPLTATAQQPLDFEVTRFKIVQAKLNYSDQQIKPNFNAHIDQMNGVIEPLTLDPNKKIAIKLAGRVEAQGQFKAKGFVIANSQKPKLDLDVDFNNIELTTFTPYAGKFAGYEISKGKMFLKLNYSLQNRFIRGKNNAVLDQFTLGRQVESDEATNLPLKLALALMKDRNGQIVINLPVEGDISSPQFSMGGLLWTALKNALINIVAAPFDFLKSILGSGDQLDLIFFEPGKSVLVATEQTKLEQLSKVLMDRPSLVLEVQGSTQLTDIEALTKTRSQVSEDELKKLAEKRAQLIQNTLVSLKVEPERVYLVAAQHLVHHDKPPYTVLHLKSRD